MNVHVGWFSRFVTKRCFFFFSILNFRFFFSYAGHERPCSRHCFKHFVSQSEVVEMFPTETKGAGLLQMFILGNKRKLMTAVNFSSYRSTHGSHIAASSSSRSESARYGALFKVSLIHKETFLYMLRCISLWG